MASASKAHQMDISQLKESFIHLLIAQIPNGGMPIKKLRAMTEQMGHCIDALVVGVAMTELVREEKVTIAVVGDDTYLWLTSQPSSPG